MSCISASKKIFSCTTHKIQSLSTYFVFVLSVFTVLDGLSLSHWLPAKATHLIALLLLQPLLLWEDYSLLSFQIPFISSFPPCQWSLTTFYQFTDCADLSFSWFPLQPAQFLLDITLRYFPQDLPFSNQRFLCYIIQIPT